MASIEQRLNALEKQRPVANVSVCIIYMDGELTEEQQHRIDDAKRIGQKIIVIEYVAAN